jgi:hypothetical protein
LGFLALAVAFALALGASESVPDDGPDLLLVETEKIVR